MVSNWSESSLLDYYDVSSGLSKSAKFFGQGYPFVSFKDVFKNTFLPEQLEQLVQSEDKERLKCSVKKGDVFITRTSETMHELGMSSVALKDYPEATFNGFTKRLRPKSGAEKVLHPEYVGYYLRSPLFRQKMLAFSTMSTRASLNNEMIGRLTISYPELTEQKRISGVLKRLDERIELNQQTNVTLDKMAQVLFKSWFVDFDPVIDNALATGNDIPEALQYKVEQRKQAQQLPDFKPLPDDIRALFPNEFEESEIGLIPKGWNIKPADEIADIAIGKTPPRKQKEWFSEQRDGNVVWVSIRDMGAESAFIGDSSEYLTPESISKFNIKVVPKDSVILSFKMTLGRVCIASCDLATNEAIAHFVNPKFGLTKEYIYSYLKAFDYDLLGSTSSIATAVNSKIIKKMPFLVPSFDIVQSFNDSLGRIFSKKLLILEQSRELEKCRDTLLPKLISGEIDISKQHKDVVNG